MALVYGLYRVFPKAWLRPAVTPMERCASIVAQVALESTILSTEALLWGCLASVAGTAWACKDAPGTAAYGLVVIGSYVMPVAATAGAFGLPIACVRAGLRWKRGGLKFLSKM